ncbi:MAG TPA: hypothetical protein VGH16_11360 [Candidatus Binatia bacterium]|jgi:hypothetical protein
MRLSFHSVGKLCSTVRFRRRIAHLDLSEVTFFTPFALVYLGMLLRHYNRLGIRFIVRFPLDPSAREYINRQQFWKRFNFNENAVRRESLRFPTATSLNDILDIQCSDYAGEEIGDRVKEMLIESRCDVSPTKVGLMISELVDNFTQHSNRSLAALAIQYYPRARSVTIAIGDCGIGIRASLCENPRHAWLADYPHHIAIQQALTPGVSRKMAGGIGFTDVLDGVADLRGVLRIATGDAYIVVRRGLRATYGYMNYHLPGVQLELVLPTERS